VIERFKDVFLKRKEPHLPDYVRQALPLMSGVTNVRWERGLILAKVDGEKWATTSFNVIDMPEDRLKLGDLDWNFSDTNALSPTGRIIGPIYAAEMNRRKLRPLVAESPIMHTQKVAKG